MPSSSSNTGSVDAAELGRREFTRSRKGWDPIEVRAHLLKMADEISRLQWSEAELQAKVARFEAQEAMADELDEERLTRVLGEETARIVEAARSAGADIRARAEENASRVVREAQEQANRVTRDAEEVRNAAAREADDLVGSARVRAEEMVAEAREAAEQLRTDSEGEATALRDRAAKAAAEVRAEAEGEAERLRTAAQSTKAEADEHAARIRREAEEQAASGRAAAEAAASELRADAETAAERIHAEANELARQRSEDASRSAEEEIERAREQGRTMVHEAREARERMLRDLAERRKVARQQLEALRAGRERLLDAFRSVRSAFDDANDELVEALPAARTAADEAARAVDDDIDAALAELDEEIAGRIDESDLGGGSQNGTSAAAGDGASDGDHDHSDSALGDNDRGDNDRGDDDRGDDGDGAPSPGPSDSGAHAGAASLEAIAPVAPSRLRLVPGSGEDLVSDLDDGDEIDDDLDDDDHDHDGSGSVEEIFARLRADQDEPTDATAGGTNAVVISLDVERTDVAEVVEIGIDLAADDSDDALADAVEVTNASTAVLDRRDEALADPERELVRRLKRALSDEENSILHVVRSDRKAKSVDQLLGTAEDRTATLVDAVIVELATAVEAGAGLYDDEDHREPVDALDVAALLASSVRESITEPLRERLERAVADSDVRGDRDDLVERLRATYRELKNERLAELAGDLLTAACNEGILAASTPGASHTWLVDHGGLPCPDGEDNHLAGPVVAGEAFPTGDRRPPAQPGCRCLLVPVGR